MSFKQFILSKQFRKHLSLALLLSIFILWLIMRILSIYTHRGEAFATPDFTGKSMTEAEQIAENQKVRVEVEDSVFRSNQPAGLVIAQNPASGHKIKSGRIIYLTLSSDTPEQVELPKLTDISLRQARALLESRGFALGSVKFVLSEFNDLVLEQKYMGNALEPGTWLDNGSTIDLVVGRIGNDTETIIPSLTGMKLEEAVAALTSRHLEKGMILYDYSVISSEDTAQAKVISQSPMADSTLFVPSGSQINLVFSIREPEK